MEITEFVKQWLWAPLLGAVSWAWNRNEKAISDIKQRQDEVGRQMLTLGSGITDRMMGYIDSQISELRSEQVKRLDQLADNDRTLFANAERDRATFRDIMERYTERSEQRHRELLEKVGDGLLDIHRALAGKVDK